MAAKTSGASPEKRRKSEEAFNAEALRLTSESRSTQASARPLGIRFNLLYRWQRAQVAAEIGSVEVARDPQRRALCASQYTATRFRQRLIRHGAQPSMSRRGNCHDNGHAEAFWRRFKAGLDYLTG